MTFGPCGEHNPASPYNGPRLRRGERCATCARIAVEGKIARRAIRDLLKAGFLLSVYDGEALTVKRSANPKAIEAAMFTTDDDRLFVYRPGEAEHMGWVWFVYGNGGWDVICDYTTNLEDALVGVTKFAEQFED